MRVRVTVIRVRAEVRGWIRVEVGWNSGLGLGVQDYTHKFVRLCNIGCCFGVQNWGSGLGLGLGFRLRVRVRVRVSVGLGFRVQG